MTLCSRQGCTQKTNRSAACKRQRPVPDDSEHNCAAWIRPEQVQDRPVQVTSRPVRRADCFVEGYCKYGDRCTFAHGDVDLRAKFVPATSLYSTATPQIMMEQPPPVPAPYPGGIDYSAFAQPPGPLYSAAPESNYSYSYGVEPEMYAPRAGFAPKYETTAPSYYYPLAEKTAAFSDMPPSTAVTSMPHSVYAYKSQEKSKFGFRYDSLVHSIDDLELATTDEESEFMFERAKNQYTFGNEAEAEMLLKQLLESGEIRYKQFSISGSGIMMSTFEPLSGFN